jgi:hypothetical protein
MKTFYDIMRVHSQSYRVWYFRLLIHLNAVVEVYELPWAQIYVRKKIGCEMIETRLNKINFAKKNFVTLKLIFATLTYTKKYPQENQRVYSKN